MDNVGTKILSGVSVHNCQFCFDGELSPSTALCWAEAVSPSLTCHVPRAEKSTYIHLIREENCGFQARLDVFERERGRGKGREEERERERLIDYSANTW